MGLPDNFNILVGWASYTTDIEGRLRELIGIWLTKSDAEAVTRATPQRTIIKVFLLRIWGEVDPTGRFPREALTFRLHFLNYMDRNYTVEPQPIDVDVNLLEREQAIREQGLAKLTPEERRVLGVKE